MVVCKSVLDLHHEKCATKKGECNGRWWSVIKVVIAILGLIIWKSSH